MLTRVLAVLVLGLATAPSAAAATLSWTHPARIPRSGTLTGVTCQSPSALRCLRECRSTVRVVAPVRRSRHVEAATHRRVGVVEIRVVPLGVIVRRLRRERQRARVHPPAAGRSNLAACRCRQRAGQPHLPVELALGVVISITCPGSGWCFAVDSTIQVHATNDAARPHSWRRAFNDQALSEAAGRFSCPSASLCVAVDDLGRVATGTRTQRRR